MGGRLRNAAAELKQQFLLYKAVLKHPDCPRDARWLLAASLGYLALPFDLIPDFIPVIGHLDDLIIVPALFIAARKRIPEHLLRECRESLKQESSSAEEPGPSPNL
ncbi:MAG: YkvA family protein [Candidatus Sumerlaeaceae bacterium]